MKDEGTWHRGFTLLELLVVFVLAAVMFSLAFPRFRDSIISDPLKASVRRLYHYLKEARNQAFEAQETARMNLDLEKNTCWITMDSMAPDELTMAKNDAFHLPGSVRIQDIWIKSEGKKWEGEVSVAFTPKGYTLPCLIHLSGEQGVEFTMEISPFLGLKIREGRMDVETDG